MADWEDASAHASSESADRVAGAPLADNPLPAETPAQAPDVAPAQQAESPAATVVDEPPFPSRPPEPVAEPDGLPEDLRALRQSLEQPTGEMPRLDVDAAAQVHASFEGTQWPTVASDAQPPAEAAAQPAAKEPAEDLAASEATTSWEALVAAATAAATASAVTAAEGQAGSDAAVSSEDEGNSKITEESPAEGGGAEGEPAAETPPEDEATAEQPAEGEGAEGETAEQPAEGESSLDDIAPGTMAAEEGGAGEQAEEAEEAEATEGLVAAPVTKVSWWPFVGYLVVWLGAAGYSVYQLRDTPIGQGVYETGLYRMSMLGGLSLLAAGPALLLIVWLASWIGRKNRRVGSMFISALLKGATATLLGAVIWIGAIVLIDYLRFGRPF